MRSRVAWSAWGRRGGRIASGGAQRGIRLLGQVPDLHLDATLVIAITYLFSAIAVVILSWRKPDLWRASPASRIKIFGVQIVPVAGLVTIGLLGYNLYEWFSNSAYGVNNRDSLYFMGGMYVLAIVVYVVARIVRNRQGIDLSLINKEIPVE